VSTRYRAVLFDLLTELLDSWSLWNGVAGDQERGTRWRGEYPRLTYRTGDYRPYQDVVAEAAGAYKPRPEAYQVALEALGLAAEQVLFVAGSRYDIPGAGAVGMPVWWHNRIHLDSAGLSAPLGEHDSLSALLSDYFR
jgi:beta-phosphoglucomutase-like phosphatase (HAD superfamily)